MNRINKLLGNSIIFAIGNLGTKFITFFLVPLYTYYLTTAEYGLIDLVTITTSLLLPLVTLSIFDGVFRFVMDKKYEKSIILFNALYVFLVGYIIILMFYPLLKIMLPFEEYISYFYAFLFLQALNAILMQYIRADGKVKLFAGMGILNAIVLLISNIIFLILLDLGIIGFFYSLLLANAVTILATYVIGGIYKLRIRKIHLSYLKEMLIYSVPLIPNALMWWVMAFSDRFIIAYFLGVGANGLYAVANKIPSLINIINSIFFQAWQISAIEEVDSKDKAQFFSQIFNYLSIILLLACSFLVINIELIMSILVEESFYESWKYIPFLLLGVVFSCFSGFLGTNYIAAKKTYGIFMTSLVGALINFALTLILIPILGLNGAAFATFLSFLIIFLIRVRDTKRFVSIEFKVKKLILMVATIILQIIVVLSDIKLSYLIGILLFFVLIILNCKELINIIKFSARIRKR